MMGMGFQPKWHRDELPVMPKGRYGIMRSYMPKKGKLGLDMLFRTCTVPVNIDYDNDADMVQKFRVGDRTSVEQGKTVSVRIELDGSSTNKTKKKKKK